MIEAATLGVLAFVMFISSIMASLYTSVYSSRLFGKFTSSLIVTYDIDPRTWAMMMMIYWTGARSSPARFLR